MMHSNLFWLPVERVGGEKTTGFFVRLVDARRAGPQKKSSVTKYLHIVDSSSCCCWYAVQHARVLRLIFKVFYLLEHDNAKWVSADQICNPVGAAANGFAILYL